MDALSNGKEAPSGPATTIVEKHKNTFRTQYGTFSDKPSENITRWLEKAEAYQEAHMIPSLEMASIVIHSIKGEPQVKVQRMLDVPGDDYKHSNHFKEQPKQDAVPYSKYKPKEGRERRQWNNHPTRSHSKGCRTCNNARQVPTRSSAKPMFKILPAGSLSKKAEPVRCRQIFNNIQDSKTKTNMLQLLG